MLPSINIFISRMGKDWNFPQDGTEIEGKKIKVEKNISRCHEELSFLKDNLMPF